MAHPYIVRTRNWNVLGRTRLVLWTLPQTVLCCTAQPWYPNFGRPCANAQVRNFLSLLCDRSLIIFSPKDPTVYTIIQDVYRAPDPVPLARYTSRPRPVLIFSAIYHFRYPVYSRTPSSSMSPQLAYQTRPPFLPNNAHGYSDPINPIRPLPSTNYPMTQFQSQEPTHNRLDEPFVLDDFSLDDFMINIHDSPEVDSKDMLPLSSSSSSFPKDIRNYVGNSSHWRGVA